MAGLFGGQFQVEIFGLCIRGGYSRFYVKGVSLDFVLEGYLADLKIARFPIRDMLFGKGRDFAGFGVFFPLP